MHQRILGALLVAFSAVALFWRLDGVPLWRDEATTAVWARLMAESGDWVPHAFDSRKQQLLVQGEDGHDVGSRLLPAMQSYLQFYVTAASFAAFGVNEWTARAPFAAFGALALFVLYRLGREMFGSGAWALAPPGLAVTSIFFLNAARQCRYYVLVVLGTSWLLLEVYRYLREPQRAEHWPFYLRLAAPGFLIYFSNYVSFLGCWTALGLFVLLTRDAKLIRGFLALCAAMAVPIAAEFLSLHAEFASEWPPRAPQPLHEIYQLVLVMRMRDLWRALPLVFLLPAAIFLCRREGKAASWVKPLGLLTAALPQLGLVLYAHHFAWMPPVAFWAFALLCSLAPLTLLFYWRKLSARGPSVQIALLAGLLLLISPLLVIAVGKQKTVTRHYYQILPAAIVLSSLAAAGAARHNRAAGLALLAGMAIWPNLDPMMGSADEVVQRQLVRDRSYNEPLIDFLGEHLQPGDRVAFLRNVKGMPMYFYFPEMRWVGLLDASSPYNQQFRGRIPDDQFDSNADADWYVFWEPQEMTAKGFSPERYELVWEYEHAVLFGPWDWGAKASHRYEVWKRRADVTALH